MRRNIFRQIVHTHNSTSHTYICIYLCIQKIHTYIYIYVYIHFGIKWLNLFYPELRHDSLKFWVKKCSWSLFLKYHWKENEQQTQLINLDLYSLFSFLSFNKYLFITDYVVDLLMYLEWTKNDMTAVLKCFLTKA